MVPILVWQVCHRLLDAGITDSAQAYRVFAEYAKEHPFPKHDDGIPSDDWFETRFDDASKGHESLPGGAWIAHVLRKNKQQNINELFALVGVRGRPDTFYFCPYGNELGETNRGDAKDWLMGNVGYTDRDAKKLMQPDSPWTITNIVFGEEYPEPNVWNP